ncbi:nickel pincer cofactor biosynthesis protein LarC [Candidatus Sumerlaeota bacterium]|nr:nickel pincer cofactor biosynthesis protein LarC [Candidatus Sumerlaeota bacterium]
MAFAYFDCYNGVSGDMTLGALIDLGADAAEIERQLRTMGAPDFALRTEQVKRCGVFATRAVVESREENPPHRHLRQIRELIERGEFSERVKARSLGAFTVLAEAEAEVHGTDLEAVHFHEVGALDSIVDIIGSMVAAELLEIESAAASTVVVGSGVVACAHGEMPVPAPATALLLRGIPVRGGEIEKEMTTPTGAAILRVLTDEFGPMPSAQIDRIGYGAGSREIPQRTNFLRVLLGRRSEAATSASDDFIAGLQRHSLELTATDIDDMSPEVYSHLQQRLFDAGALDVCLMATQMKKNRPGVRVEALSQPESTPAVLRVLLEETSTLGARVIPASRYCFPRVMKTIKTKYGEVTAKIALLNGAPFKGAPEYEDCRRLAEERQVPLRTVMQAAQQSIDAWIARQRESAAEAKAEK